MSARFSTPAGAPTYFVPISNGIFAHCRRIGAAVWVFMWLIDHITREEPTAGGQMEGFVLDGRSLRTREIAQDLEVPIRTVQNHLDQLVKSGYLRRIDSAKGLSSGYSVLKSKKWNRPASDEYKLETEEPSGTPQDSAQVRNRLRGVRNGLRGVRQILPPYIETIHNKTQTKEHAVLTGECESPSKLLLESHIAPEKPAKTPKPAKVTIPPAIVDGLYHAYPRHVAPGGARQAILKAIARIAKADGISHSDAAEKLLQRVEGYAVQVKKAGTEMQYVPYPATWFNGERYDDDSLQGESDNAGAVRYTDPASIYESPEYSAARRSA